MIHYLKNHLLRKLTLPQSENYIDMVRELSSCNKKRIKTEYKADRRNKCGCKNQTIKLNMLISHEKAQYIVMSESIIRCKLIVNE